MNVGEKIFSNTTNQVYTIFRTLKIGGQSEVGYATSNKSDKLFFVKRFLSIKYSKKLTILVTTTAMASLSWQ